MNIDKGRWIPSMHERHHQGTKLASSKIVICSLSSCKRNLFHDISVLIAYTTLFLVWTNRAFQLASSTVQNAKEVQGYELSTCLTSSHLTFRLRFLTKTTCLCVIHRLQAHSRLKFWLSIWAFFRRQCVLHRLAIKEQSFAMMRMATIHLEVLMCVCGLDMQVSTYQAIPQVDPCIEECDFFGWPLSC